jgi:hypothetical protein
VVELGEAQGGLLIIRAGGGNPRPSEVVVEPRRRAGEREVEDVAASHPMTLLPSVSVSTGA